MQKPRLFTELLRAFLAVVVLSLAVFAVLMSVIERRFVAAESRDHLAATARVLAGSLRAEVQAPDRGPLVQRVRQFASLSGMRVTVIAPDGVVLADSDGSPAFMENHAGRAEVAAALRGETGIDVRHSASVNRRMVYVAVPMREAGALVCVVRTSLAARTISEILARVHRQILALVLVMGALAAGLSYYLSRRISQPLERMTDGARAFAEALARRIDSAGTRELAELAEAMNRMAENLEQEIRTIERLLQEQKAVFFGMTEGLLVFDHEENLVEMNQAAADMLRVDAARVKGRNVLEVVRNLPLQDLVVRTLKSGTPVEDNLVLHGEKGRHVQVHGTAIRIRGEEPMGALVVLTDVTRLKELEGLRRDFVANASHELKTPVTAIKGFAETLLGEAHSPEEAKRFAGIIQRQADQLSALIEDLLDLTRIEHERERGRIQRVETDVDALLRGVVALCAEEAAKKNIRIEVLCPPGLLAQLDPALMERALVNLVENAVRYSDRDKQVRVEARMAQGVLEFNVMDEGYGISPEHLPRVFERFYRVDKARSRKLGGTGLGLAIVKHVAQAHGGEVSVQSEVGRGSVFSLRAPA